MPGPNDRPPYLQNDALDAVREIYTSFLNQQVETDRMSSPDMANRLQRFEQGQPDNLDRAAVDAALEKHVEIAEAGGTSHEAAAASKEAFNEAKGLEHTPDRASDALLAYVLGNTIREAQPEADRGPEPSADAQLNQYLEQQNSPDPHQDSNARDALEQYLQGAKQEITKPALEANQRVRPDLEFER